MDGEIYDDAAIKAEIMNSIFQSAFTKERAFVKTEVSKSYTERKWRCGKYINYWKI